MLPNAVQSFQFDHLPVRVVLIEGEPWFVAKDVASLLGYADTKKAVSAHCKASIRIGEGGRITPLVDLHPQTVLIPERDVYRLVMRSNLASAERFEEWVVGEVLPSIRKTGGYSKPMSQVELLVAQAQALLEIERRTLATQEAVAQIEQKVERLEQSSVWDHCPQNCEPITRIRKRMSERYGLPPHIVDTVMRGLPLSPKIAGMVRNNHEDADGQHYAVWAVADVTRVFKRFVAECERVSTWFATHPDIEGRFKLAPEVAA
ncbi:MAG TPA: BRO family protein [Pseudomonas sp.]|nr:BRO family protein [Pseudomonas sp.]